VNLVQVERVHAEAVERRVEFLLDGLPREATGVGVVLVHLEEHLRGDDHLVPTAIERVPEDAL